MKYAYSNPYSEGLFPDYPIKVWQPLGVNEGKSLIQALEEENPFNFTYYLSVGVLSDQLCIHSIKVSFPGNKSHLFLDEFSGSHLESHIEGGKKKGIPQHVAHAHACDEKVPHRR